MKFDKQSTFKLNIKAITEEGLFQGYAACFNNKDSEGDIIQKGAFKRTISLKQGKWPILWQHDYRKPIGSNLKAEEDEHGLKVEGSLFINMPSAREAYEWLKGCIDNGLDAGLSIGFRIIDKAYEDGVRILKEIALVEYSIVTFPANDQAMVSGVKASVSFQDFPLAPEKRAWSASAAVKRAFKWAGGEEQFDSAKFKTIFLIYDSNEPNKKESYKLPIADIIDGKPMAVPKGIAAAAGRLNQTDATDSDKKAAQGNLERYYVKMNKVSPFKDKAFNQLPEYAKAMDFTEALSGALEEQQLRDLRWVIEDARCDALCSVEQDDSMSTDQKVSMVGAIFDQYGKAMTSWYSKYLAMQEPDDPGDSMDDDVQENDDGKAGAKISASTKKAITEAIALHDKAYDMHRDANKLHNKGTMMLASLVPYQASQSDPGPGIPAPTPTPDSETQPDTKAVNDALEQLLLSMSK